MKYVTIFAMLLGVACSSWAQSPQAGPKVVGKLAKVEGLVTVGTGDKLANAISGAPLIVGTRIVTTSSGGVTLSFNNGCDITLKANESIIVKDGNDCAVLAAGIVPIGGTLSSLTLGGTGVVAAGAGGAVPPAFILAGAAAAVVIVDRNNSNVSAR